MDIELRSVAALTAIDGKLVVLATDGTLWTTAYAGSFRLETVAGGLPGTHESAGGWQPWQQLPHLPQPGSELEVSSAKCIACAGMGLVHVNTNEGHTTVTCGECGGTGLVNAPPAAVEGAVDASS